MARPKADLPDATAIRALADGAGRLAIRVTPGARRETITIADGRIAVAVRTPPEDGKATAAALVLLARALGVPVSAVTLLRGATVREKLLRIPPAV